jgi:sodium pump decarboxylase gamma subunit
MIEYYNSVGSAFGYFTADSLVSAFSGYESSIDDLGDLVSIIDYDEPVVKNDEITLNTNIAYEKRNATLSIVFNKKGIVQSVTLDPKYSLGEILGKALMNTILGMGTVFAVLIFISLIIYCFNFIPDIQAKFSRNKINLDEAKATSAPAKAAAAPVKEAEDLIDDGELVAAITAAICAYNGSSSDGFVVRSIKRAESAKWKRA